MTTSPHFLYGPGEDALALTKEFGAIPDENATLEAIEEQRSKILCRTTGGGAECEVGEGNFAPQVLLFVAQFISGIGGSLYYTLGVSYMDDNTKKSKTPALLSKLCLFWKNHRPYNSVEVLRITRSLILIIPIKRDGA